MKVMQTVMRESHLQKRPIQYHFIAEQEINEFGKNIGSIVLSVVRLEWEIMTFSYSQSVMNYLQNFHQPATKTH